MEDLFNWTSGKHGGDLNLAAANKIIWAGDTNLYRNNPNQLKTDDDFVAGANLIAGSSFFIYNAGTYIYFSDGAGANDVNLYRNVANQLKTDDEFVAGGSIITASNFLVYSAGLVLAFGNGAGSYDTNLYRAGANTLKTDDSFVVALNQQINGNLYFYTSGAYIYFGDSAGGYDVNLYRAATNVLMTDNAMVIAQGSMSYAKTVLSLSQADIDDTFIDFKGTSATDKTRSISTSTIGNFTYTGMVRVDVNGTQYWMPYYA